MTVKRPCVYILASQRNGTLYVGVTTDLAQDYAVHRLVFVEFHETMADAILREKRIKKWRCAWKLELIERANPQWRDLYDQVLQ